jgi:hypothetical protein
MRLDDGPGNSDRTPQGQKFQGRGRHMGFAGKADFLRAENRAEKRG